MLLIDAERRLETADGVWRHVACGSDRHWFYVGSRNLDLAHGIWLRVRPRGGRTQQIVADFGLDEGASLRGNERCREVPMPHS